MGKIPTETLLSLRSRLKTFPARSVARKEEIARIAALFGVSTSSVYRSLKSLTQPKGLATLTDTGLPEIRRFLKGKLDTDRTEELSTMMRRAGLPL